MLLNPALQNIQERIHSHIESFTARADRDKKKAYFYRVTALALTLTATIALGITWNSFDDLAKNIAFTATALVSFTTGMDMYFNHKALWVQYVMTRNQLYALNDEIDYLVAKRGDSEITEAELDSFQLRLQRILDECNDWWASERTKKEGI